MSFSLQCLLQVFDLLGVCNGVVTWVGNSLNHGALADVRSFSEGLMPLPPLESRLMDARLAQDASDFSVSANIDCLFFNSNCSGLCSLSSLQAPHTAMLV